MQVSLFINQTRAFAVVYVISVFDCLWGIGQMVLRIRFLKQNHQRLGRTVYIKKRKEAITGGIWSSGMTSPRYVYSLIPEIHPRLPPFPALVLYQLCLYMFLN